ncbi:MAG: right-handed parallel beta-helix repeat-containing protein, partial [Calditrichaceae bacterium]
MIRFNLNILVAISLCAIAFFGNSKVFGQNFWTAENSPYYVNSDTIVSNLRIEAGVKVLFTNNFSFTIDGEFQAIGAQYDSIYFKPAPGNSNGWKGITFNSLSSDLKLDFCSISGASTSGIIVSTGFVTITNSVSFNNSLRGLNVTDGTVSVINSKFENNDSYGIYVDDNADLTLYATRVSDNGSYGISSPSGNLEAYNTIIDHNTGYGVYTSDGDITLRNVVIADNNTGLVPQNGTINISNSIIYSNGAQSIVPGGTSITVMYSDIEGGYAGTGNIGDNTATDNPEFINEKYELSGDSPCINAGNPDVIYNDQYFPPSLQGTRNDMGAYGGPDACKWYYPLYINPYTLNYGNVDLNESVIDFVAINNYSGEILDLDSISIAGADNEKFSIINIPASYPVVLGENESREFEIEFTPGIANASPYEAILNFYSENGTKAVPLEGKGVQADIFIDPEIEENGYDFGNINVGDSTVFELIIKNFGTGTLHVNDFTPPDESVNIENFESFEIAPNPALSETLIVKFKPMRADTLDGNLIILSNDPQYDSLLPIVLNGIGMAPEISANQVEV